METNSDSLYIEKPVTGEETRGDHKVKQRCRCVLAGEAKEVQRCGEIVVNYCNCLPEGAATTLCSASLQI